VLELGADFNDARYVDSAILERHRQQRGNKMLCELVFLFNAPLLEANHLAHTGPAHTKPTVMMQPSPSADPFLANITAVKDQLLGLLGAEPLPDDNLDLKVGRLGGVAHEVGTLRLGAEGNGVVDTDLKFLGYDNLYACDLSVFCSSPAANPSLTLAALAIRAASRLKEVIVAGG
jgi:choline dehydrogenase-like flavoprotein